MLLVSYILSELDTCCAFIDTSVKSKQTGAYLFVPQFSSHNMQSPGVPLTVQQTTEGMRDDGPSSCQQLTLAEVCTANWVRGLVAKERYMISILQKEGRSRKDGAVARPMLSKLGQQKVPCPQRTWVAIPNSLNTSQ